MKVFKNCRFVSALLLAVIISVLMPKCVKAEKPKIDCSKIRGVCYTIYDESRYDEARIRRELGYGLRVGLNTVRFWLDQSKYKQQGDVYIQKVVDFVRICDSCGYKCMPILFNGNFQNQKDVESAAYEATDKFTTAIVNALKNEPGLLMFDMMNEPLCNKYIGSAHGNERAARERAIWDFLRREIELAEKLAPDCLFTVGYTTASEIEESTAKLLDVISFHDYNDTRESMRRNYETAKQKSEKLGKPFIQSETGCIGRANSYEMALQCCDEYKCGWILFNLIIDEYWNDIHGIFYPDGTIRDAGTIAAMCGCYRNRGENSAVVPPHPNREGKAEYALRLLREGLKEKTYDCFAYSQIDKKKLLDACEVAANLLEACELVPMSDLPTTKIIQFRNDPKADLWEMRKLAYELANRLKEACQIID